MEEKIMQWLDENVGKYIGFSEYKRVYRAFLDSHEGVSAFVFGRVFHKWNRWQVVKMFV